jgi:uncharacterized protein (UPF0333 family)
MNKRGQVAVEYMVLIGVLLLIVAFIAGYAILVYNETISTTQFQSSIKNLSDSVNNVYYLGNGNSMKVEFTIPSNVVSITFQNNTIVTQSNSFNRLVEDLIILDTNVIGDIPIVVGTHDLLIKNINGDVNVGII